MKKILILVLLVVPSIALAQTPTLDFTEHLITSNFDGSGYSFAIDLDGDDDIDIVSTANLGNKVVWFENDGHENFTEHEIIANFINAWDLNVLDIDHDGDLDIWVESINSELTGSSSTWFENDGEQNFTPHNIIDVFGVALASPTDFNGDGIVDFVEYNYNFNGVDTIRWFEGIVGQDFVSHITTVSTAPNLKYINFFGDIDGDKDRDYIVKDTITNAFFLLENQNGQSFQKHPITIEIENEDSFYFGSGQERNGTDIDKDGDRDLLAFSISLNQVYWYENDGNYNYTRHTLDTSNAYPFDISSTDINQDGYNDIIVTSYSDNQLVGYLNDGNQNFTKKVIASNLSGPIGLFMVDLDNDNDNDIVANGSLADNVVWFETKICIPKAQVNLSQDQNYIYNIKPQVEVKSETELNALNCSTETTESVIYFDGLGRPKQQIGIGQSPTGNDIISHIAYDAFGRQAQDFLPYVDTNLPNDGSYNTANQELAINSYYQTHYPDDLTGIINPYSEKSFEPSPLNRVLEQAAPGSDWRLGNIDPNTGYSDGHTIKFDYQTNTLDLNDDNQDNVRLFSVSLNTNYKPTLVNDKPIDYYQANQLYKTITKDENWTANQTGAKEKNHTTEEFKDKQGRVVLKRTYNANTTNTSIKNTKHDTYYVYDDYGNLTYVIPPRANINNDQSTRTRKLNELCYQYRYDGRNRLIRKKIPGKGWESIVYDKLDRPILTQTKNLKDKNQWLFTKYDAFGRIVYTGKYNSSENRNQLQNQANTTTYANENQHEVKTIPTSIGNATVSYSHRSFPENSLKVLTINYYDNYDNFDLDGGTNPNEVLGIQTITNTKSLATASQVRVLGTNQWINTITYYDKKARPIYNYSKNNYLNTVDIVKTQLNFIGNVMRTVSRHTKGNESTIKTVDRFRYDHANRLLRQTQQINNQEKEEVIAENKYDELGQLIKKGIGNETLSKHLQDIDYTYNIRGWLKGINEAEQALTDDLFSFKINYNTISTTAGGTSRLATQELYNGNISETIWRTASDNKKRGYGYKYDALNRIKRARYKAGDNLTTEKQFFDIKNVNYDKNGNIKRLDRFSPNDAFDDKEETDHLTYEYYQLSNRLKLVTDATGNAKGFKDGNNNGNDYSYDLDGNLISDANKGLFISYNHLNLPVSISNGSNFEGISYVYDANGVKLKKTLRTKTGPSMYSSNSTLYAGNYVYEDDVLQFFNHPEGYFNVTSSGNSLQGKYVYQYKDHLGNIRLSYSDANNNGTIEVTSDPLTTEIIEENNYYPFGLKHKGYNGVITSTNPAQDFKYNGIELEESLGLNLYEMDMRQYDPAIARWTSIDPVTHDAMSTYTAFDNNPVFWADPSGADAWESASGYHFTGADAQAFFARLKSQYSKPDDDKRVDSKTGKTTITKTGDSEDRLFVDGKFVRTAEQGSFEKELIANGTEFTYENQREGVGMGAVDGAILFLAGEIVFKWAGMLWASSKGSGLILNAKWAQKTFNSKFGKLGKFSGQSVDNVSAALRSGRISPGDVPIDFIIRDGQSLILNTRSSAALMKAGIPRSQWNSINRTGQEFFENQLTNQLTRNNLTSAGTSTIRESGTTNVIGN